jgi:hypothetical protein
MLVEGIGRVDYSKSRFNTSGLETDKGINHTRRWVPKSDREPRK